MYLEFNESVNKQSSFESSDLLSNTDLTEPGTEHVDTKSILMYSFEWGTKIYCDNP